MKKNIFLFLIFTFLISCISSTEESCENEILFDYNDSLDKFDLGTITDSLFQIIPLETAEKCLISTIEKIEIRNDRIYIKDKLAKSIYIYDMDGKYSGKISAVGQGPGEYTIPSYMTVTDSSIIIVDNPAGKQIEYDLSTLKAINEKRIFNDIWCTEDIFTLSGSVYYVNAWSESNLGNFRLFSSNGNDYMKYLPFEKQPFGLGINGPVYAIYGDSVSLIYSQDDLIYSITNDCVIPKYKIRFKNQKVDYYSKKYENVFDNPPGRIKGINAINESDKFLFISIAVTVDIELPLGNGNYDYYTCLYNKLDGNKYIYPQSAAYNSIFDDDQINVRRVIDNKLIDWRDAHMLKLQNDYVYSKQAFDNKAFEKRLKEVLSNLKEDDNPVLFIYNLK